MADEPKETTPKPPEKEKPSTIPLAYPPALIAIVRQKGAERVLDSISKLMMKIYHPHSGRVIETIIQQLSDEDFEVLEALINIPNAQEDELVNQFASTVVVRLAVKQGLMINTMEPWHHAKENFLVLITAEARRRKGEVEYLFPENLYISHEKLQYVHLTKETRDRVLLNMLMRFDSSTVH